MAYDQILREMRKQIFELERQTAKLPNRIKGGGGGGIKWHIVATKAELPSVAAPALGYVTGTGRAYVRITAGGSSKWFCLTNIEAP